MKHLNQFFLRGMLGKDPEVKSVGSKGNSMAKFPVAFTKNWKDDKGEWQKETTWFNVVCWGRIAEAAGKLSKGTGVQIEGSIQVNEYEGKYYTTVLADNLTEIPILKAAQEDDALKKSVKKQLEDEEDIPF